MTDEPVRERTVAPAHALVKTPDWEAVRRDYESSSNTLKVLACRHGVEVRQLQSRREREGWWRPARRLAGPRGFELDAIATMARRIEQGTEKLIRRDARLMRRVIDKGGDLDDELEQHRGGIASLGALLKMVHTLRKLRPAPPPSAENKEEKRRNARREVESRLARIAEAFQAAENSPDTE